MKSKQFILLGLPGIGVEAQAIALAERWQLPYISMGQLLQAAIAAQSPLSAEVRSYTEAGKPVPEALMTKLIRRRLEQPDAMLQGWVLEGFPCSLDQAQALDEFLAQAGLPAATVVYLRAMTGLLVNRLWNENKQAEPVSAIRQRLSHQQEAIAPVLEYYQQRSQLTTLNGSLPFAEVASELFQLGQPTGAAPMIKDEAELDSLLAAESVLVVDCMAAWCGSCKLVTPLIDQLAVAYGDRVKVMKIDFDANQQIPQRFGLKGMPAVMFFKEGELQETLVGVKPYQEYSAVVSRFLA
ncbi:MAG: AAA family ATPase [Leptolyngbya sp. SIO4C5]|nr:AAA family ATPase [Leptolyngbya sp. SIO4C5]